MRFKGGILKTNKLPRGISCAEASLFGNDGSFAICEKGFVEDCYSPEGEEQPVSDTDYKAFIVDLSVFIDLEPLIYERS